MQIRCAVTMEDKESFAVIGKAGRGPSEQGPQWISPLWQSANAGFAEIADLVRRDENGLPRVWGAMNDIKLRFQPWGETGAYLAGCEAKPGVFPPPGWELWQIPAFRYAVIDTSAATYGEAFRFMLQSYLPEQGLTLAGAVQEHYPEPGNSEKVRLFFPVASLSGVADG